MLKLFWTLTLSLLSNLRPSVWRRGGNCWKPAGFSLTCCVSSQAAWWMILIFLSTSDYRYVYLDIFLMGLHLSCMDRTGQEVGGVVVGAGRRGWGVGGVEEGEEGTRQRESVKRREEKGRWWEVMERALSDTETVAASAIDVTISVFSCMQTAIIASYKRFECWKNQIFSIRDVTITAQQQVGI